MKRIGSKMATAKMVNTMQLCYAATCRDIVYVHASAAVVSLVVAATSADDDDDAVVSLPGTKSEKCAI